MKLFTDAGNAHARFYVQTTMLDWEAAHSAHSNITLGIALGFLSLNFIAPALGSEIPPLLTLIPGIVLLLYTSARLLWFTFHPKELNIKVDPKKEGISFLVNRGQLLWETPVGDIPIFRNGYRVTKEISGDRGIYTCYGQSSISFTGTLKQLMSGKRIWGCHRLTCQISPDAELYPEAIAILEELSQKTKA